MILIHPDQVFPDDDGVLICMDRDDVILTPLQVEAVAGLMDDRSETAGLAKALRIAREHRTNREPLPQPYMRSAARAGECS